MSLDWSTIKDLELPFGKVKKIEKPDGTVLWQKGKQEEYFLTFHSPSGQFGLNSYKGTTSTTAAKYWNGTIEYSTDKRNWATWSGYSPISGAGDSVKGYTLYVRGSNNTHINTSSNQARWQINGTNVSCTGNIETILDWQSVKSGIHPKMDSYCFAYLFYRDTSLIECPMLPATTLASNCYQYMFYYCTNLMTVPALPATAMQSYCYAYMFYYCSKIKFSKTKTGDYQNEYRIPSSGSGSTVSYWNYYMFNSTGGTFVGDPSINTTYYTSNTVV